MELGVTVLSKNLPPSRLTGYEYQKNKNTRRIKSKRLST